ncbi:MAG: hypothetical protein ACOH16_09520 [Propionibacteriaceae bacterium]
MLYSRAALLETTSERELRRLVRDGDLVRIATGMYVDGLDLSGWPEQIHAVKTRAHGRPCAHVVSHVSAAVLHKLPVPGADLTEVHFSRPGHGGNDLIGDRRLHAGDLDDRWLTSVDGIRVTNVPRTVVDVARTQPQLAAVAAIDAALHRGLTDPAELVAAFEAEHRWVGSQWARRALKAADGRPESPGETWARLAVADLHPGHELQFSVYDPCGAFVARADGGWPSLGLLWEYDGQSKYEELRPVGTTREDVMAKQARRQTKLERLSWTVVRGGGEDLPHRDAFRARVAEAVWAVGKAGWAPPRGRVELMPPLAVDVREPIQWAAVMREEMYERWRARRTR